MHKWDQMSQRMKWLNTQEYSTSVIRGIWSGIFGRKNCIKNWYQEISGNDPESPTTLDLGRYFIGPRKKHIGLPDEWGRMLKTNWCHRWLYLSLSVICYLELVKCIKCNLWHFFNHYSNRRHPSIVENTNSIAKIKKVSHCLLASWNV